MIPAVIFQVVVIFTEGERCSIYFNHVLILLEQRMHVSMCLRFLCSRNNFQIKRF